MKEETELCPICGGDLKKTIIKERINAGGKVLVIEGIPAKVCSNCGERIVDYENMRQITEEVKDDLKQIEEARTDYKAGRFKKLENLVAEK